jgi:neutral ceramidase
MGRLRVGAIKKEITPPLGTDLFGYIRRFGTSKGVHDPLRANFLSLEESTNQVLLISLDILAMDEIFASRVREEISRELNIKKRNILVAAIHTHSSPGIHLFRNVGKRNRDWEEKLLQTLITGASESIKRMRKGSAGGGMGFALIGKNRRKEGGAVDPCFPLLCFRDEENTPLALIANYGCHPVVLDEKNLLISADYVGYFRNHLNKFLCANPVTLFFCGANGDVDPVQRGNFSIANRLGKILAAEASKVIKKMKFQKDIEIKAREVSLKIPYGWIPNPKEAEKTLKESRSRYEHAVKKGEKKEIKIRKAFLLWAKEIKEKALKNKLPSVLETRLQCLKLGEAILLAHPFELFSSVSLSLRLKSKIESLFLAGYANGYGGYLPDEKSCTEGGYEVDESFKYCGILPLSVQAEKIFTRKALFLIENIFLV